MQTSHFSAAGSPLFATTLILSSPEPGNGFKHGRIPPFPPPNILARSYHVGFFFFLPHLRFCCSISARLHTYSREPSRVLGRAGAICLLAKEFEIRDELAAGWSVQL